MATKRKSEDKENVNPSKRSNQGVQSSVSKNDTNERKPTGKEAGEGNNAMHGHIFQLKLLMLFVIRAIRLNYDFEVDTEIGKEAGKFDDVIFKYKKRSEGQWRCLYVQAKHKQNPKAIIRVDELFPSKKKKGPFCVHMYFNSYCEFLANKNEVEQCILLTNASFDGQCEETRDILQIEGTDVYDILCFEDHELRQYKLKESAKQKLQSNTCPDRLKDFFEEFKNKFTFYVNMPNEEELSTVLKCEIGNRLKLHETDLQSAFILETMLKWFIKKETKFLTAKDGENIFKKAEQRIESIRLTENSNQYLEEFEIKFEDKAIENMKRKLKSFINKDEQKSLILKSKSPKWKAAKIANAIKNPIAEYSPSDCHLFLPLERFTEEYQKRIKHVMELDGVYRLVVIICENQAEKMNWADLDDWLPSNEMKNKVIVIKRKKQ